MFVGFGPLTAIYMLSIVVRAFFPPADFDEDKVKEFPTLAGKCWCQVRRVCGGDCRFWIVFLRR